MAAIYRGSPTRLPSFAHTHYTTNIDPALQIQMQLRYNALAVEGHSVPMPSTPPTRPNVALQPSALNLATPPPGATLGLLGGKHMPVGNNVNALRQLPLYTNPTMAKTYQPPFTGMVPPADVLLVSPGVPTPIELSIYENKQPTGFLHVTIGNQTVEFLDGVANMPLKR